MRRMNRVIAVVSVLGVALVTLGGCAMSREDRLRAKSEKVADQLASERDRILEQRPGSGQYLDREARLSRLNTLRTMLSAANVGLGSARYLPETDRDLAFDVIEEAYSTIEWNIPLGPSDQMKPMPSQFEGGVLRLR
jgi:hypothetical protein